MAWFPATRASPVERRLADSETSEGVGTHLARSDPDETVDAS